MIIHKSKDWQMYYTKYGFQLSLGWADLNSTNNIILF